MSECDCPRCIVCDNVSEVSNNDGLFCGDWCKHLHYQKEDRLPHNGGDGKHSEDEIDDYAQMVREGEELEITVPCLICAHFRIDGDECWRKKND